MIRWGIEAGDVYGCLWLARGVQWRKRNRNRGGMVLYRVNDSMHACEREIKIDTLS